MRGQPGGRLAGAGMPVPYVPGTFFFVFFHKTPVGSFRFLRAFGSPPPSEMAVSPGFWGFRFNHDRNLRNLNKCRPHQDRYLSVNQLFRLKGRQPHRKRMGGCNPLPRSGHSFSNTLLLIPLLLVIAVAEIPPSASAATAAPATPTPTIQTNRFDGGGNRFFPSAAQSRAGRALQSSSCSDGTETQLHANVRKDACLGRGQGADCCFEEGGNAHVGCCNWGLADNAYYCTPDTSYREAACSPASGLDPGDSCSFELNGAVYAGSCAAVGVGFCAAAADPAPYGESGSCSNFSSELCVQGTAAECGGSNETWLSTSALCCVGSDPSCSNGTVEACGGGGQGMHWTGALCCVVGAPNCVGGTSGSCVGSNRWWTGTECCVGSDAVCVVGDANECDGDNEWWTGALCCVGGSPECVTGATVASCNENNGFWTGERCCVINALTLGGGEGALPACYDGFAPLCPGGVESAQTCNDGSMPVCPCGISVVSSDVSMRVAGSVRLVSANGCPGYDWREQSSPHTPMAGGFALSHLLRTPILRQQGTEPVVGLTGTANGLSGKIPAPRGIRVRAKRARSF